MDIRRINDLTGICLTDIWHPTESGGGLWGGSRYPTATVTRQVSYPSFEYGVSIQILSTFATHAEDFKVCPSL